jgi:hypothetical protein
MENLFVAFAHILSTIAKLLRPGGAKALVSKNLILKQQLLIINRSRQRAPNLTPLDRLFFGFLAALFHNSSFEPICSFLNPFATGSGWIQASPCLSFGLAQHISPLLPHIDYQALERRGDLQTAP